MKYKEIKNKYQPKSNIFADKYCMFFSPFLTKIFLKTKVTPNEITIMMILSGVIGAVLFAFKSIPIKIIGVIFIHLWYILDCTDGEVARAKQHFSRFGKEIDYSAHILNHPLFNIAFAISLLSLNRYNSTMVLFLTIIVIFMDSMLRNIYAFEVIYELKMIEHVQASSTQNRGNIVKESIKFVVAQFLQYPNYALIFPIVFLFDFYKNTNIGIVYLILIVIVKVPMIVRLYLKWVFRIKDIR